MPYLEDQKEQDTQRKTDKGTYEYEILPRKTLNSIRTDLGSVRHGQLVHPRCFSDNTELPLLFIWRLVVPCSC